MRSSARPCQAKWPVPLIQVLKRMVSAASHCGRLSPREGGNDVSPRPSPQSAPEPLSEERLAAAEAEAARRSFLRMMSHELRTPLNSIINVPAA